MWLLPRHCTTWGSPPPGAPTRTPTPPTTATAHSQTLPGPQAPPWPASRCPATEWCWFSPSTAPLLYVHGSNSPCSKGHSVSLQNAPQLATAARAEAGTASKHTGCRDDHGEFSCERLLVIGDIAVC